MLITEQLIERYPLKLVPLKGDFHALVWYDSSIGHHAVVAPSEKSVLAAYVRLRESYTHYDGGDPKKWWTLRVVAPPRAYVERYAQNVYKREVDSFRYWLFSVIGSALIPYRDDLGYDAIEQQRNAAFRKLSFFRLCPYVDPATFARDLAEAREEGPEEVAAIEVDQANYRAEHRLCDGGCHEGLLPASGTWAELYETHKHVLKEDEDRSRHRRGIADSTEMEERRRFRDDLPERDPARPLFAVVTEFGHHRSGLVFADVSDQTDKFFDPGCALFFFQGETREFPTQLTEMLRAEREHAKQEKALDAIRRKEEKKAEYERVKELAHRLFPGMRL